MVPLGDRLSEAVEAGWVADRVGLRNIVADAVVVVRRIERKRARLVERSLRISALLRVVTRSMDWSASNILAYSTINLGRIHSLILLHCLIIMVI